MNIMEIDSEQLTNVMKQYYDIKIKYPNEIVLFQLGDFYEMFFEDANIISRDLELTLTGKKAGLKERIPMCGVPLNSIDDYLKKMLDLGYTLVIVDQVQSNELGNTLVNREVSKVVSKGTYLSNQNDNNFIGALTKEDYYYLSYGDVSTGELYYLKSDKFKDVESEIINNQIIEIVINNGKLQTEVQNLIKNNIIIKKIDETQVVKNDLDIKFNNSSQKLLLDYLSYTQVGKIQQFKTFKEVELKKSMFLSYNTQNQLELIQTNQEGEYINSLFWYLNETTTAMGKRLLKKYILHPLVNEKAIVSRQKIINQYISNPILLEQTKDLLKQIYDFERLIGKVINSSITPKEIEKLKISLRVLPDLYLLFKENINDQDEININFLTSLNELYEFLNTVIIEDAPQTTKDGNFIKKGYNKEIDELRNIKNDSNVWLSEFELQEQEKTGIKNLKVKYNKIFGYFIEITNSNIDLVPENYIKKQTMANCQRFITEELKEQENKILNAHDMLISLELKVYNEIKEKLKQHIVKLQNVALTVAKIDVFSALSIVSINNNLVCPTFNNNKLINIQAGRHPIVEKLSDEYIQNDIYMDKNNIVKIITGPNMAGKSTYMRMLSLITIMAQIGSNVPAKSADLMIFDSIYTRIGASDNLAKGKSTFMVEMLETTESLKYATENSLLIYDELGRGTSTYDGISLTKSIIDYIVNNIKAKTLFSTHYHELIKINEEYDEVDLVHVKAQEVDGELKFHHKVINGGTNKSYGIEVAQLAGINKSIILNAKKIYNELEKNNTHEQTCDLQFEYLEEDKYETLLDKIKNIDLNNLTPMQAINVLSNIKEEYDKKNK